ncbi:MAG TPA: M48 family metallopeptidase [Candidatus Binatia bacterium]|nr:M48 family metallopeptidase [Candidatus Binatia bacterium]
MSQSLLPLIVGLAILAALVFGLWLDLRQIRWVRRRRDAVPDTFAGRIPLEDHRRSIDYAVERLQLSMADSVVGSAATVLLLLGGGFALLLKAVIVLAGSGYLAGLLLAGATLVVFGVVALPFAWWRTFRIEQKYGFNRTTFALFVADLAKGALVAAVLGTPLVLAIDFTMRNGGAFWWLAAWGLYVAFNLAMLLIIPTLVMPLFNKFEPLGDASLKGRIEALLARCGFHARGVFTMDGSKRSGHGNAFFTGLGPSKRIVLFDTIMASLTPSEIEAVLAHELGHFKLRHILKRMLFQFAASLLIFALLGWLIAQPWFAAGFGVAPDAASALPLASLILFLLALPAFTGWFRGFSNWRSRVHEFEADAYAAGQTNGPDLASALLKLHKDNASPSTTDPLYSTFKYSHPPTAERIARLQATA